MLDKELTMESTTTEKIVSWVALGIWAVAATGVAVAMAIPPPLVVIGALVGCVVGAHVHYELLEEEDEEPVPAFFKSAGALLGAGILGGVAALLLAVLAVVALVVGAGWVLVQLAGDSGNDREKVIAKGEWEVRKLPRK